MNTIDFLAMIRARATRMERDATEYQRLSSVTDISSEHSYNRGYADALRNEAKALHASAFYIESMAAKHGI